MKKRILITATELNLVQFWVFHIENLIKNGYRVDIVCSHVGGRLGELKRALKHHGDPRITVVDLKRSPLSPHNIRGYFQMKVICQKTDMILLLQTNPLWESLPALRLRGKEKKEQRSSILLTAFISGKEPRR